MNYLLHTKFDAHIPVLGDKTSLATPLLTCQSQTFAQNEEQSKYIGPYTVSKVTDSHVTISQTELRTKEDKKIPIHTY